MKVELKYKSDKEYIAVNDSGNSINIDMYDALEKKSFSPMQLLLSGVLSCAAVDVVSMIKKRRKTLVDFKGSATGERAKEYPMKFIEIHVHYIITSPDLNNEEAERAIALTINKYCSVASSLDPSISLKHSFEIIRS